ncbi:MAG TPA: hypothetical protein IAC02_06220, partial [Candidatus Coprovivens excrementavium]|nr:hypothetical protein [Candidatus Coprovivens excrementavium]
MSYVRVNKSELNTSKSYANSLVESLSSAKTNAESFIESAKENSSSWLVNDAIKNRWKEVIRNKNKGNNSFGYYTSSEDSEGNETSVWNWYDGVVEGEAINKITAAKTAYDALADNIYNPGDSDGDSEKVNDALNKIIDAINLFEDCSPSLEEALKTITTLPEGFSVEKRTINLDGEEVQVDTLVYTAEDGTQTTIAEQVNSFYTFTGITADGAVAIASLTAGKTLSEDELRKLDSNLNSYVKDTASTTALYEQKGFYSIASMAGIAGMYTDATGLDYDEEQVKTDYNSIISAYASSADKYGDGLTDEVNSGAVGSAAMFGLVGNAIANKGALSDDEKKKAGLDKYIATDEDKKENLPGEVEWPATTDEDKKNELLGGIGAGGSVDGIGIDNLLSETEGAVNLEDSTNDSLELDPDESLQTDYEADRISDIMDKLGDSDLPANIDPETRTPEEIDSEARDEYFEQNEDTLYVEREQHIDEYQSMDESEKQSALEELGYSKEDAAKLVAAPAAGQTAYVYGKFNQSLSNASNNIAAAEGVNNFVSGYDSKNTLTNVTNKTANVELTPTSDSVQTARQQLTVAKDNYDSSVTKANDAIDKASTAKDKYNKVLKNIQDKNGEDPKNWTDEQVDEYNEAATMYNDAVKEAQEAAKEVESAKQSYNQEKEQYQAVYDKWREEAEEDVGITGSEIDNNTNSSEPNTDGIVHEDNTPVQTIPDKIDDD